MAQVRISILVSNSFPRLISGSMPFSNSLLSISRPKKQNVSTINLTELHTSCFSFHLRLAPRFHRGYFGGICNIRAVGMTEDGDTPVTTIVTPWQSPSDYVCPKNTWTMFQSKSTELMRQQKADNDWFGHIPTIKKG